MKLGALGGMSGHASRDRNEPGETVSRRSKRKISVYEVTRVREEGTDGNNREEGLYDRDLEVFPERRVVSPESCVQ